MSPQPLDLEKRCGDCKFLEWSPSDNTFTCSLTGRVVKRDFECELLRELEIKQRLKSACEFYMKYMNSPEELYDDELNLRCEDLFEFIKEIENSTNECCILVEFNEWLFRLVFKDVLGDDEK